LVAADRGDLLRITVDDAEESQQVVRLRGEVDMGNGASLEASLANVLTDGSGDVVIDLSELRFMDSTGLRVLLGAWKEAGKLGRTMVLRSPRPSVATLLAVSGVDQILTIEP
jgi:anti-anti-sigma factor